MGSGEKLLISDHLEAIRSEIREYYGQLNEVKLGARSKAPERPEEFVQYEIMQRFNLPLVAGGLMDQPWLWLQTQQIISEEIELQRILENASKS